MLSQKIALESSESRALGVARRFAPDGTFRRGRLLRSAWPESICFMDDRTCHCPSRTADLGACSLIVTPSGPAPEDGRLACRTGRLALNEDVQRAIFIAGDRSNPTRSEGVIAAPLHVPARPVMAEVALLRSELAAPKKKRDRSARALAVGAISRRMKSEVRPPQFGSPFEPLI
jgi:hypothetical protein